jgi:predicted DCC family thiol-disulfide oxidoreductase YuxK
MAERERLAQRLATKAAFSWRDDPAVPTFPDDAPVIVFDGVCVLCSAFARFVARRDRAGRIRFVAAQSQLGQALFRHFDLDTVAFETNLLLESGRAYGKLDAVCGALRHLGPGWTLAANLMSLLPRAIGDWLYDRVALNRYALFGRTESCVMPDASWRDRVIGDGESA